MTEKIRFATKDLPAKDRVPFVRDFYGRSIMGLEMSPLGDANFEMDMSVIHMNSVGIAHGFLTPLTAERTKMLAGDGNGNILLGMCDSDFVTTDANGQAHLHRAGDVLFMPLDQEFKWTFPTPGTTTAIHLDRDALAARIPGFDPGGVYTLDAGLPGTALLFSYARALHDTKGLTREGANLASRQLLDLAAFLISEAVDPEHVGVALSVRAARYLAVQRDVARHFHDPRLSIRDVAARQKVTPRYLQILFDDNGKTFTNYLHEMRLNYARARLLHARFPMRILDVALESGFADLSTFNRVFRKHFGYTPSSLRNGSRDETLADAG